ncbi:MAG: glycosyltransferase [Phycisphaerae bacterium]|nr:glycosyltransferase [Phycisphaerae bacterium]MDD5381714.1 glycosyltransferase [Phycisphaerae bacterium]
MVTIIVPTYNASKHLPSLLVKLESQTFRDYELMIVDSSSNDDTVDIARDHRADVMTIPQSQFDHGGTRTLAAKKAKGDILIYLTQDALPYDEYALENIIKPFADDKKIGAAFGRQVPYFGASLFAEQLRAFNYPNTSYTRILEDRKNYGIKTAFLSNSFAAYRKSVLEEIGYFKSGLPFGEDACAGAKILLKGYKIAYVAEAIVRHSHNYTIWQDLKRYFDMGMFHRTENWLLEEFGKAEGEGIRYAKSEIKFLFKKRRFDLLPVSALRLITKYLGYKLGTDYVRVRPLIAKTKQVITSSPPSTKHKEQSKIALVCDWLTAMRGGERCLDAICEIYPDSDIFTLVHFPGFVSKAIESHKIRTSYVQHLPGSVKNFRIYLPFFPHAIQRFDLSGYEYVLSFSHCVAKGIKVPKGLLHICYCHTPMRYAWHMRDAYMDTVPRWERLPIEYMLNRLKNWDAKASSRVTHFIANSKNTQNRIKEAYGRDSVIIYPPVECSRFAVSEDDDGYYLVLSALVPYKRIDIAVQAFSATGQKLVIVGNGPELPRLKSMASANISFVDNAGDNQVVEYLKKCRALIFPGEEDFGIVPLEAQACGKQVIAFGRGGALETVIGPNPSQGVKTTDATGIFFYEQTPQALRESILLFEKTRDQFDPRKCRDNVLRFDRPLYQQAMQNYIQTAIAENR